MQFYNYSKNLIKRLIFLSYDIRIIIVERIRVCKVVVKQNYTIHMVIYLSENIIDSFNGTTQ